jgi:methionyl-tRNA synthetase
LNWDLDASKTQKKRCLGDALSSFHSCPDATAAPGGSAVLPEAGKRNVLVTAALPYVNNVPHLGNIIGCVLSGDVYARYCRSRGYTTVYIGGTDEYGTATEAKALLEGLSPREICDKYHALHKDIYRWFGISFDHFGRTSEPKQTELVQGVFRKVLANGWLKEDSIQQLYSEQLGKFLADRFVEGTCPKSNCAYKDARGDQCDKCGTLLNPTDLLEPRCKFTGTTPVLRTTRHLFLDLPGLESRVSSYIDETSARGGWTNNAKQVTAAWLRDGLKPRCITRDLKWGVPVPHKGFEDKVFYVWFDAPIGYISITAAYTAEWERWWKAPKDVELVQFLGKDNIPFHTVIFPASLLATGEQWTLLERISVSEYLKYEDGKFSKSRSVGVFGDDAQNTGIHADVWRYYLLSVRPEQSDAEFRWNDFAARNNNELLKNVGNFCHRVLDFVASKLDGVVPVVSDAGVEECTALGAELASAVDSYIYNLEKTKLREGLRAAISVSTIGNAFLTACEPWKCLREDPSRAGTHVAAALGVVRLLAALLSPFLPTVAGCYLNYLGLDIEDGRLSPCLLASVSAPQSLLVPGHRLGPRSRPLFREIDAAEVEALRARFSGPHGTDASAPVGGA